MAQNQASRIGTEMRITIEIPKELMSDVMALSKTHNEKEAIRIALEEFVRHKKAERLLALSGKIDISDVTSELEEMEIKESNPKV